MVSDKHDAILTAQRMIERYSGLKYTPGERASDHAYSYDANTRGRRFWLTVLEEIVRIEAAAETSNHLRKS